MWKNCSARDGGEQEFNNDTNLPYMGRKSHNLQIHKERPDGKTTRKANDLTMMSNTDAQH